MKGNELSVEAVGNRRDPIKSVKVKEKKRCSDHFGHPKSDKPCFVDIWSDLSRVGWSSALPSSSFDIKNTMRVEKVDSFY